VVRLLAQFTDTQRPNTGDMHVVHSAPQKSYW